MKMNRRLIIGAVMLAAFILFLIGDRNNEPFEIQSNGATMCMACIGLE
jgi:hypothetical protein